MLILTFTAGGNRYAVEAARVIELVPRVELRCMPHAPAFLAGLLDYRGTVVPVVDLGLLLGSSPCQDRLSTRIILVNDTRIDQNGQKPIPKNRRRNKTDPAMHAHECTFFAAIHGNVKTFASGDQFSCQDNSPLR